MRKQRFISLCVLIMGLLAACGDAEVCEPVQAECLDGLTYEACCNSSDECTYVFSDGMEFYSYDEASLEQAAQESAEYCLGL